MKFKYILATVLFITSFIYSQDNNWEVIQLPDSATQKSIKVLNDGSVFVLTDLGLYRTTNSGISWKKLISAEADWTQYHLKGIIECFNISQDNVLITSEFIAHAKSELVLRAISADTLRVISVINIADMFNGEVGPGVIRKIKNYDSETFVQFEMGAYRPEYYRTQIMKINSNMNSLTMLFELRGIFSDFSVYGDSILAAGIWINVPGNNIVSLIYSSDSGSNWQAFGGLGDRSYFISSVLMTKQNTFLYGAYYGSGSVGGYFDGIFRSYNEGQSWENVLRNRRILKIMKSINSEKYYAIKSDSIFFSLDDGKTWQNKNKGQIINNAIDFDIDSSANVYILSSTALYKCKIDSTAEISEPDTLETNLPYNYFLNQNYPNPFNAGTVIEFTTPEKNDVVIKIYDVLGREVCKIFEGTVDEGKHKVTFNPINLPTGIYFYRMITNNFTETKKLIFLK